MADYSTLLRGRRAHLSFDRPDLPAGLREHRFAQAHGIPMLHFAKGENKEQLAWPLIDKAAAEGGAGRVVLTEPGDELPENSWCNADLDLPNAGLHGEIPTLRYAYPRAARAPDRHPSDPHRGKACERLPRNLCDGEQPGHHRRW
jgi:hypothetical protein